MNKIYLINKIASDTSSSEIYPVRTFKGDANIEFNFSNIIETHIKLVKIKIDFNDGNTLEKVYNSKNDLFESIHHTYTPSSSEYIITRHCSVNLVFSNFTIHTIIVPINIAQSSFMSEYGSLNVKKAQFIVNKNIGDMFLILESEKHNLYNACIKTENFVSEFTTVTAEDTIIVTDNDEPIISNFNDKLKTSNNY